MCTSSRVIREFQKCQCKEGVTVNIYYLMLYMNVLKDWCFLSQYANCISLGVRVIAEKGFSASSLE